MPGPGLGADKRHVLGGLVEGQTGEERWPRRVAACRLGVPGGLHCPEERTASHVLEGTRGLLSWGARAICAPDRGVGTREAGACSMVPALQVQVTDSLTQSGHQPDLILRPWQG